MRYIEKIDMKNLAASTSQSKLILYKRALIHFKTKVGRQLDSEAILEDANCTKVCLYLSFVLLLASVGFELTGIEGIDSVGAILIAVFAFREGRESFEKAHGIECRCD